MLATFPLSLIHTFSYTLPTNITSSLVIIFYLMPLNTGEQHFEM
jgi:hypothetical protein